MRRLPLFLICLGALAFAGCEGRVTYEPKSTQDCVLNPADHNPTVTMDVVTAVRFVLPGPTPTSTLGWVLVGNNILTLGQMDALKYDGKTSSIRFYAEKPGRSIVRFVLVHPNDREAIPVERYSILVIVKDE